jgi:D-glycero-beta-D-manno-heptose-7-phosphate kinase
MGMPSTSLPTHRVETLLAAMSGVRVLVVGDLMLDRYLIGSVERISPEAPVPVVRVREERWAVGGAANVAANVLALGASCEVVGCVGEDEGGKVLRRTLREMGGGISGVVTDSSRPTTTKTRVLARSQQVVRFDSEEDVDVTGAVAGALEEAVASAVDRCDVLVLEDYNKGVLVPGLIRSSLEGAGARGLSTVVDPKRRNFFQYRGVTVFKPNAKELEEALGEPLHPDDPDWMEETRRRLDCRALLLTLGERGMSLTEGGEEPLRIPAVARSVYDVSGAGDTVTAVTACVLAVGGSLREAAVLSNHAAAIEVGKAGVATVTALELLEHCRRHEAG